MVQLNRELNQEWIFRISFPKYSWRISLSLQLPLESSKHLCPHALTANIHKLTINHLYANGKNTGSAEISGW